MPTAEATHAAYAECTRLLLVDCPVPQRTSAMFATHNEASVREVIRLLADQESNVPKERVGFGQVSVLDTRVGWGWGKVGRWLFV
jgi:hypothetical protein